MHRCIGRPCLRFPAPRNKGFYFVAQLRSRTLKEPLNKSVFLSLRYLFGRYDNEERLAQTCFNRFASVFAFGSTSGLYAAPPEQRLGLVCRPYVGRRLGFGFPSSARCTDFECRSIKGIGTTASMCCST